MKELNQALNSWLEKYGFDTVAEGIEPSFGYYYNRNSIVYTLSIRESAIKSWNLLMEEMNCPFVINQFYTSFLHELGHAQTLDLLTEEEEQFSENEEIRLSQLDDIVQADYEYYHLPREIIATEWAMNFMRENENAIKELVETTAPILDAIATH